MSLQKFWLPSGSVGEPDPDFIEYVVDHAIKGSTTTGLKNYDRRVSVYKDLIFTTIIPESGGFDDFETNFDAEFLGVFDKVIQNNVEPTVGGLINVNDATKAFYEGFIHQLNYSTDIIPQIGLSTRPKIWYMKNRMNKQLGVMEKFGDILQVADASIEGWKNFIKVMLIKSYQDSEAQLRLSAWQSLKEKYTSEIDPALVEAINRATTEINEYFDSESVIKMTLENYFSDLDTYVSWGLFFAKKAATLYAKHLGTAATYHLTSSFAAALGPVLIGITVALK